MVLTFFGVVGWLFYNEFQTQEVKAANIKKQHGIRNEKQFNELQRDVSSIKMED